MNSSPAAVKDSASKDRLGGWVFCVDGQSRGNACQAAVYLMRSCGFSLQEARTYLESLKQ